MILRLAIILVCHAAIVGQDTRVPSEFRLFTDKKGQEVEARILSVDPPSGAMKMERRDGNVYETAVTILSLDDQQFVAEWLNPKPPETVLEGKLKVFGILPGEKKIDVSAVEGITGFKSIHAAKSGWIVLLPDGKVMDFSNRFPNLTDIQQLYANTVWIAMTNADGGFVNGSGKQVHPEISTAVECVYGSGNSAARLADGTVKIFGKSFKRDDSFSPPGELGEIVSLASTQSTMAALAEDGTVHCWSKDLESTSGRPGDGAVEIQGSIFNILALTRGGEVYQWSGTSVEKAKVPSAIDPEVKYSKVRANGNTFAARQEDGQWTAWGTNGAGIIDHIKSLGPVEDIAFFSEPGKVDHGYVIWIEKE